MNRAMSRQTRQMRHFALFVMQSTEHASEQLESGSVKTRPNRHPTERWLPQLLRYRDGCQLGMQKDGANPGGAYDAPSARPRTGTILEWAR